MNQAVQLRNRMVSIFNRKGGEGEYARLFDHLDQWQQNLLSTEVPLRAEEAPVIGGVEGQEKWFLITTRRIVWRTKGSTQSIPMDQVSEASMDFKTLSSPRAKLETQDLQITTLDDRLYRFPIEEGSPLIGVWNVLKHMGFRNRKNADIRSV